VNNRRGQDRWLGVRGRRCGGAAHPRHPARGRPLRDVAGERSGDPRAGDAAAQPGAARVRRGAAAGARLLPGRLRRGGGVGEARPGHAPVV